jgi:beta-mannosidase
VNRLDGWDIAVTSTRAPELAARLNAVLDGRKWGAVPLGRAVADVGLDLVEDRRAGITHGYLDDLDVTYRTTLAPVPADVAVIVTFASIAAIATVTCNGREVATSHNQSRPCVVDLTGQLVDGAELTVTCHALTQWLDRERRPRPRWKTKLVAEQRLRHVRLGLLGRIPSWTPPVPVIGLAGPVTVTTAPPIDINLQSSIGSDLCTGYLDVDLRGLVSPDVSTVSVRCHATTVTVRTSDDGAWRTSFAVPDVKPWWPHTHGDPVLYPVELTTTYLDGSSTTTEIARTGFRSVVVDRGPDGDGFALTLNGTRIFWRGSAWMPMDVRQPWSDTDDLRAELLRVRDSGANMIRLTGVTGWEQPEFTRLCDELGISVWQDLPFATLDQPTDDAFVDNVTAEIRHHIRRLAASPSVLVLCGGSERQQQAAMLGLGREVVEDALGSRLLRELAAAEFRSAVVVDCSPSGGHLPFAVDVGVSHYYGVGAYLRPLTDARHANVRFTTECLAFANVPEPQTILDLLDDGESAPTDPQWKARVARDRGVGWDFEDVRDHYFRIVTGHDPATVRWRDTERYLELSRVVSAIVMSSAMHEWRRPTSTCGGALTWFLRDLWRGAGWGLIDSDGRAKAAWSGLGCAWAPVAVGLLDEGVNGVDLWIHNDRPVPIEGTVEITRTVRGNPVGQPLHREIRVEGHASLRLRADDLAGRFTDPSSAFLFGPAAHDALCARLLVADTTIASHVLDTSGGQSLHQSDIVLAGSATWLDDTTIAVEVSASGLARFVRLEGDSLTVDRHHFDLVPGETRQLVATLPADHLAPSGLYLAAVNARSSTRVSLPIRPHQ